MYEQVGPVQLDENGLLKKGVIIRHLILPGQVDNAKAVIDYVAERYAGKVYFSLERQYIPCGQAYNYPEINRRVTEEEYKAVEEHLFATELDGFVQEEESASESFVPDFDLGGVIAPEDEEEFRRLKGEE